MRKMISLLAVLMVFALSGCATEQGSTGGYGRPSGHQGQHH